MNKFNVISAALLASAITEVGEKNADGHIWVKLEDGREDVKMEAGEVSATPPVVGDYFVQQDADEEGVVIPKHIFEALYEEEKSTKVRKTS